MTVKAKICLSGPGGMTSWLDTEFEMREDGVVQNTSIVSWTGPELQKIEQANHVMIDTVAKTFAGSLNPPTQDTTTPGLTLSFQAGAITLKMR